MLQKLMTVEEVSDLLSVKKSTIYQWTHIGFIPHIKLGNKVRFRESDIEAWLEKRAVKGRTRYKVTVDLK